MVNSYIIDKLIKYAIIYAHTILKASIFIQKIILIIQLHTEIIITLRECLQ